MFKDFIYVAAFFLLAACGGDSSNDRKDGFSETAKNPEDSLFQEVMDGHDEAMAKMGKLSGYQKQLDQKIDSLRKAKSAAKVSFEKSLEKAKTDLKQAEEDMNKWMHEFSIDSAQDNIERRLEYLKSEKTKVRNVRNEIFEAIGKADSLLKK
jgi:hypothetical protein